MSRSYSQEFVDYVTKTERESAGIDLARLCIKANLPAAFVAQFLGVSRMTVYTWFRGEKLRFKNMLMVESLTARVQKDLDAGRLPVDNKKGAKAYLEELGMQNKQE